MPTTPTWSITYPDSSSNLTPLESHFAEIATDTDAALTTLKSNVRGANTTDTLETLKTSVTAINTRLALNLQTSGSTPVGAPTNSGLEGSMHWDSTNNILYIYDNTAGWKVLYKSDGTWVSYTPTISGGTTTLWTLGNGVLAASYTQINKTVHFKGSFKIGSTTVIGDTSLAISLPLTSVAADANGIHAMTGTGRASLSGLASTGVLTIIQTSTTAFTPQLLMTPSSLSTPVSRAGISSSNYTKTAGDLIIFSGTYEVA